MKELTLYVQTIRRKKRYTSGYKHACTEYAVYDGEDKLLETDSIFLSNRDFKKGKYGVKQLLEKKGFEKFNLNIVKLNPVNNNF